MKARPAGLLVVVACTALTLTALAAAPAQAYDNHAYAYAAGHMIDRKDIPAELGVFKKTMTFNAYSSTATASVCTISGVGDQPETTYSFNDGKLTFNAAYSSRGTKGASLMVNVYQYDDRTKAIAAFDEIKKAAPKCTGTVSNTFTSTESGAQSTYTVKTTNGVVPAVTTTGVESIFVNVNYESTATTDAPAFLNDQYSVLSLINDVIIVTNYYKNDSVNVSKKQRKAVNQVSFNAETVWVG